MKIIIPMSGLGQRFVDVGYDRPKPLIRVNGKTIIEHVVSMFPTDSIFVFICNEIHLATTGMRSHLSSIAPTSLIVSIPQQKKGPVYAVRYAYDHIDDDEPVLISYCDYYMDFDIAKMLHDVEVGGYDGAVPSYTGFHPHLLHKKLYGGVLVDETGLMKDYKEKHSFTEDPMGSHHSAGMYYFASGAEYKKYAEELMETDESINGEQYTSMVYYLYLRDGKQVLVPAIERFMQWGTPEDLEEYEAWSRYIHKQLGKQKRITDVPASREPYVALPYDRETQEFKKCYTYWRQHVTNIT